MFGGDFNTHHSQLIRSAKEVLEDFQTDVRKAKSNVEQEQNIDDPKWMVNFSF